MNQFSKNTLHKHHSRTISHRVFGKIYHISQRRLNRIFFGRAPEIYIRAKRKRFVYFRDDKVKTPYEFIGSCTEFIAHKNYSIRTYEIRKVWKCRQKQKF